MSVFPFTTKTSDKLDLNKYLNFSKRDYEGCCSIQDCNAHQTNGFVYGLLDLFKCLTCDYVDDDDDVLERTGIDADLCSTHFERIAKHICALNLGIVVEGSREIDDLRHVSDLLKRKREEFEADELKTVRKSEESRNFLERMKVNDESDVFCLYKAFEGHHYSNRFKERERLELEERNIKEASSVRILHQGGVYFGEVQSGLPRGFGEWKGEHMRYEGDWYRGHRCRFGKLFDGSRLVYKGSWENGKRSGQGVFHYSTEEAEKKRKYKGCWSNDHMTQGTLELKDGTLITGGFSETNVKKKSVYKIKFSEGHSKGFDQFTGFLEVNMTPSGCGEMIYKNGDIYKGLWENGQRSGDGKMTFVNGDLYSGGFFKDQMQGTGQFYNAETREFMKGEFKENSYVVKSSLTFDEGTFYGTTDKDNAVEGSWTSFDRRSHYTGPFLNNQFSGYGNFSNSTLSYTGEFCGGRMYGEGKMKMKNQAQEIYEGFFENDRLHCIEGKKSSKDEEYFGEFRYGKYDGKGILTQFDGTVYEGDFEKDKYHGKGILTQFDGTVYEGDFKEDKYHGEGTLKSKDGSTYEGLFQKGKKHGEGVLFLQDKTRHEVSYFEDREESRKS